jgi:phytoene dehydrogenase-like protein
LSAACGVSLTKLNDPEQLETLKEQLIKRLERIVPFLNRFMELTSIPASSKQDKENSALGRTWNVHPIFANHPTLHLGLTPKGIQTCFKNLYQGGREMIPGLGLEGEYISALGIADEVTKQLEKRKN